MYTGTGTRLLGCFCMSGSAHKMGLTILIGYKIQHRIKTFHTILVPKTLTWFATNYNAGLTVDELSIINFLHIERKYNQGCKTYLSSLPWRFNCKLEHLEEWRFKRVTYKNLTLGNLFMLYLSSDNWTLNLFFNQRLRSWDIMRAYFQEWGF